MASPTPLPEFNLPGMPQPYVFACFATSLDGRIEPANATGETRPAVMLGSKADLARLRQCRAMAEVLILGASTLRAYPKLRCAPAEGAAGRAYPHLIFTQSGQLDATLPIFQHPALRGPLSTEEATLPLVTICSPLPAPTSFQEVLALPQVQWEVLPKAASETSTQRVKWIQAYLRQHEVKSAMIEGGGTVLGWFIQAKALQRLYLTTTPWLLGEQDTPALLSGVGYEALEHAPQITPLHIELVAHEVFWDLALHYR